jgi:enoyl-CoA hydratase/carnithine racemase
MAVSGWQHGRVRVVVIDRPERANAIDLATSEAPSGTFDALEADDDTWAVVLTGAGERAFSAAVELAERICANGPAAVRASKRVARSALTAGEAAAWRLNDGLAGAVTASEDAAAAASAARDKRPPAWSGR